MTSRRRFNQTLLGAIAAGPVWPAINPPIPSRSLVGVQTSRANQPHDPNPRKPEQPLPAGACDAHIHLLGPFDRYPLPAGAPDYYEGTLEQYLALMAATGIERAVIVHVRRPDQQPTLDALRAAPDRFRGIASSLDDRVTDATLETYDQAGFRGIRAFPSLRPINRRLVARIAELGWHLQIRASAGTIVEIADQLRALPCDVVIDQMGGPALSAGGVPQPEWRSVLDLLREPQFWVKLCAPMKFSVEHAPPYTDALAVARLLIETSPERCVWGTDWPHVNYGEVMPNDGDLIDLLTDWCPDDSLRRRILVDNPSKLYGFAQSSRAL